MVWQALLLLLSLIFIAFPKELRLYFLDVGEGESIVVETPSGKVLLIDTGNFITGYKVYKFLKEREILKIDKLIITHPHPDHMGGVFLILQSFAVKTKHDNGQPLDVKNCSDMYRWYEEIFRYGNYQPLKRGDEWSIDNVRFKVLSPSILNDDWNANSLVIKIEYRETSFLLTGDANRRTEKELINSGINLKSDVLKVGHHGAPDALSEEFLKKVSPKYAIISIDANNVRGYPSYQNIELLKRYKVKLYTTYSHGTIKIVSNGEKISISTLKH